MPDIDAFKDRVDRIENNVDSIEEKVAELAAGQSAIKAMLKNGIKENLINVNTKIDSLIDDRQTLVMIKTKLLEHIDRDNRKSSGIRFNISTVIAVIAVGVSVVAVLWK